MFCFLTVQWFSEEFNDGGHPSFPIINKTQCSSFMPDHIFSDFQIDSESYIRDSNGFKNKCERENTTVFFLKIYRLIYIWGRALVVIEGNKNAFV